MNTSRFSVLSLPVIVLLAGSAVYLFAGIAPDSAKIPGPEGSSATHFINTREARWFDYKSPLMKEAYPFGMSDAKNNALLDQSYDFSKISKDNLLSNKSFLAENDWYAVEWHYSATSVATGKKQRESSLCLGQVKDGLLVWWIEYFDDTVGELQMTDQLPLPAPTDEPMPWPAKAKLKRPYRL